MANEAAEQIIQLWVGLFDRFNPVSYKSSSPINGCHLNDKKKIGPLVT